MTPEQELARAHEAQRWLDDALFKAAREDVYGQLRAARIAAPTTSVELHSKLVLMEQVAERFFGYFEQLAQTGKFAALELQQQEQQRRGWAARMRLYATMGRNGL